MHAAMPEYLWLVVVGSLAAFAFGWATGSNDVANAFGTSVGAKTLTLKQAVLIAAVFEFAGALLLGRVSTAVIAGNIAKIDFFYSAPEIYAYGMICALAVGFVWQGFASYLELNVSATHSIIGAIIGFTLVYGGGSAVNWATPQKGSFPPYGGVVPIVCSWFISPILTMLCSALLMLLLRTLVLRRRNPYYKSFYVLPFAVFLTTFINIYFIFTKGIAKTLSQEGRSWSSSKSAWVAVVCGAGLGVLTAVLVLPILRHRTNRKFNDADSSSTSPAKPALSSSTTSSETGSITPTDPKAPAADPNPAATASNPKVQPVSDINPQPPDVENALPARQPSRLRALYGNLDSAWHKFSKMATHGLNVDIHKVVEEDPIVACIHAKAEVFDPKAEYAFQYLQVFSAVCVMFAHGAGEVGYMAGPLTTVWDVYRSGTLHSKVVAPIWVTIISAGGLVVGLATYGYNVTRAMGTRMAKLSPTRGFCAEISTAIVIMVAAQYGLPTSSSQCITGGIIGVGVLEGRTGVNWKFFAFIFASWVMTLAANGLGAAALFAQGAYAPSVSLVKAQNVYETQTIGLARSIYKDLNATLYQYRSAALADPPRLPRLDNDTFTALAAAIKQQDGKGKAMLTYKSNGTIKADDAMAYLARALALVQNNTVVTIGQQRVYPGARACNDASYDPAVPATSELACPPPNLLGATAKYNTTKF